VSDEAKNFEPLIGSSEAAKILGLAEITVRIMAAKGRLPGLKVGRCWRFRVSSLDAWIRDGLEGKRDAT